jgi:fatty-acyl-CoA synthase
VEGSPGLRLQPDAARLTLPRFLDDVCARHGARVALRFEGRSTGYETLGAESLRLARGLAAAGVVKGARVALLLANRPEWVAAAFAAARLGAVVVPVSTFAPPEERDWILRHADAAWLLMQPGLGGTDWLDETLERHPALAAGRPGAARCPALPQLRGVFCLGLEEPRGAIEPWRTLADRAAEVPEALVSALSDEVHPGDDGLVIYTSGTTARPKGVVHTQRAPVIQAFRFAELMGLGCDDRVWTAQPFFWTAGIAMSLGASLAAGATLILQERFAPAAALDAIESERATTLFAWPHQEKALAEHPSAAERDWSSVRRIEFSSPLAPLAGLEEDAWGTYGAYGLSETFTLASALPADAPASLRRETSGRPLPGTELRIVDPETGAARPTGEPGEIAVRGLTLMRGYAKVPREAVFDADGFFHTGDGGFLDAEGLLHWTGRLSNLVKTGGANVSPLEVEEALVRYPGLHTAHAVGVPHPTLGEALVLCAVPVEGASVDPEALRAFLRERLAAYKVPRHVLCFTADRVSWTGSQKLRTGALREAALARLAAERVAIAGFTYGAG